MKKLIQTSRERKWYLIKKWKTKAGLTAYVNLCEWDREFIKSDILPDHYTGYVEVPNGDETDYYRDGELNVHGGVTFCGIMQDIGSKVVGFDMAHYGDEKIPNPIEYAVEQCEKLAHQMVKSK